MGNNNQFCNYAANGEYFFDRKNNPHTYLEDLIEEVQSEQSMSEKELVQWQQEQLKDTKEKEAVAKDKVWLRPLCAEDIFKNPALVNASPTPVDGWVEFQVVKKPEGNPFKVGETVRAFFSVWAEPRFMEGKIIEVNGDVLKLDIVNHPHWKMPYAHYKQCERVNDSQ